MPHNFGSEYDICGNPFSDEMPTDEGQNSLNVGNHNRSRYPEPIASLSHGSKQVAVESLTRNSTFKRPEEPADVLCRRPNKNRSVVYRVPRSYFTKPEKPTYVLYRSKPKPSVFRTVPCNEHSTNTFANLQKDTYSLSTFMYVDRQMEKGVWKEKETHVDKEKLYNTIVLHKLTEVLVGSESLVSLESNSAMKV